jgi:NADPH2:quinone reductase
MAGVVERIGPSVTRFRPGDRVWCNNQGFAGRQGTFAECLAVGEEFLYSLPAGVDEQLAVAFAHAGLTACIGLAVANLQAGETLFLRGGAGNVGSAVLQLSTLRGARVVTTAGSAEGVEWCRSLGASRVINYKTEDVAGVAAEFAPGGLNVYWDTSGRPDFDEAVKLLARRGRIVLMAGFAARPPFPVGPFYVKNCSLHGFAVTYADQAQYQAAAAEINAGMAAGKLQARIDRIQPLSEAATAHRLVESGTRLNGKIVLVP